MNNKTAFLILIAAFVVLLTGAGILYSRLSQSAAPEQLQTEATPAPDDTAYQPTKAPDFTVYDREGNAVKLSSFVGKPVVLNFWASWCGPCQMEMPDFDQKYQELGENVHFLMVNMTDGSRETVEKAASFIAGKGYRFPVFYDTDTQAAYTYNVYSLPTTYFIDADGYLVAHATGAISGDTLQRGIDMIYSPAP